MEKDTGNWIAAAAKLSGNATKDDGWDTEFQEMNASQLAYLLQTISSNVDACADLIRKRICFPQQQTD